MIRGIGPIYAKREVQGFREAAFDLIEQQTDRLCQRRMKTPRWADVARPILVRSVPAAPSTRDRVSPPDVAVSRAAWQ